MNMNISFSENKLIVDLNSNFQDCSIKKKTEKELHGFWQTDMVEFLTGESKSLMIKLRRHFVSFVNSL